MFCCAAPAQKPQRKRVYFGTPIPKEQLKTVRRQQPKGSYAAQHSILRQRCADSFTGVSSGASSPRSLVSSAASSPRAPVRSSREARAVGWAEAAAAAEHQQAEEQVYVPAVEAAGAADSAEEAGDECSSPKSSASFVSAVSEPTTSFKSRRPAPLPKHCTTGAPPPAPKQKKRSFLPF